MKPALDPNVGIVELVAAALGPLCDELVLVGGCSVGLLITDKARPPVRQTVDVDMIAQVASVADYYHSLHPKLKARGFTESPEAENICRWRRGTLIVDVMPTTSVLGHSVNGWYKHAVKNANAVILPSGSKILLVSAPVFLATKLESFHGRGGGDYLHHDMEDIVNVVDGREELLNEVKVSSDDLQEYLREEFDELLSDESFVEQLSGHFAGDGASQARVPVVLSRLRGLAGI